MAETVTLDSRVHETLAQIFIVFGQGAGTMLVSREAIRVATHDYAALVRANLDGWAGVEHQVLEYARGLGRLAAHLALHDGAHTIEERHYRDASERYAATADQVSFECPLCLRASRKA